MIPDAAALSRAAKRWSDKIFLNRSLSVFHVGEFTVSKHPSGAEGGNSSRAFRISLGAGHAVFDGHPRPLRLSIEEHPRRDRTGSAFSLAGSACVA